MTIKEQLLAKGIVIPKVESVKKENKITSPMSAKQKNKYQLFELGWKFFENEAYNMAKKTWQEALQTKDEPQIVHPDNLYKLGLRFYDNKIYDMAETIWKKAVKSPDLHPSFKKIIVDFFGKKEFAELIKATKKVSYADAKGRGRRNVLAPDSYGSVYGGGFCFPFYD